MGAQKRTVETTESLDKPVRPPMRRAANRKFDRAAKGLGGCRRSQQPINWIGERSVRQILKLGMPQNGIKIWGEFHGRRPCSPIVWSYWVRDGCQHALRIIGDNR